jgi:tRNA(adenine34) deaminase
MSQKALDERWMRRALLLAKKAAALGEVPVGSILVGPEGVIAQGYNLRETLFTPLGHAEILTLHRAAKKLKNWRLANTTLYVTLEPCLMCAGALLQSRVGRVVYGAKDPKGGAIDSFQNQQTEITSGILEKDCALLLQKFFQKRRLETKSLRDKTIYRRRTSVIVVHKNKILGFHAVDPFDQRKFFFLPGGQIEPGETAEQAVVRETLEETGYKIRLVSNQELRRRYEFNWNGKLVACDTLFFVGVLDEHWHEPNKIEDADYNKGADWVSVKDVNKYFSYHPDVLWGVQWGVKRRKY